MQDIHVVSCAPHTQPVVEKLGRKIKRTPAQSTRPKHCSYVRQLASWVNLVSCKQRRFGFVHSGDEFTYVQRTKKTDLRQFWQQACVSLAFFLRKQQTLTFGTIHQELYSCIVQQYERMTSVELSQSEVNRNGTAGSYISNGQKMQGLLLVVLKKMQGFVPLSCGLRTEAMPLPRTRNVSSAILSPSPDRSTKETVQSLDVGSKQPIEPLLILRWLDLNSRPLDSDTMLEI